MVGREREEGGWVGGWMEGQLGLKEIWSTMGRIYESQCFDSSVLFPSPPSISVQPGQ